MSRTASAAATPARRLPVAATGLKQNRQFPGVRYFIKKGMPLVAKLRTYGPTIHRLKREVASEARGYLPGPPSPDGLSKFSKT